MKIFLDTFFNQLYNRPASVFDDYLHVPHSCNIVGISFYHNNLEQIVKVIDHLAPRTQKLLVNLSEPTNNHTLMTLLSTYDGSNVYLFSDVVLNFRKPRNFSTIVSWFIQPENFYATRPWAKERLQKLTHHTKTKKFDCLLGTQRSHRDFIEASYLNSQYQDQIIFNYYKDNINQGTWDADVDSYLVGNDPSLPTSYASKHALIPIDVYNQSYYSIVAETTQYNQYNQYTEKVAKPILAGRPFVAFAGQHYLANLRQLGFKTFSSVIDESYDYIPDMHQRMTCAWQQVESLCEQDPQVVYQELQSVLEHNQRHFIETNWHKPIQEFFNTLPR